MKNQLLDNFEAYREEAEKLREKKCKEIAERHNLDWKWVFNELNKGPLSDSEVWKYINENT